MNQSQIFSKEYLFDPTPSVSTNLYTPLLVFFCLLIVIALATVFFIKGRPKEVLFRFVASFLTTGFLGLLALFARYESLPWLASRFFTLLILGIFTIWFLTLYIIMAINYAPKIKDDKIKERYNKYLPNNKSKKA